MTTAELTNVLVIDDSATIRKLIEIAMRGSAYVPHFSALGSDGVALAKRLRPAAILLDCVLPDATGPQVCRELAADEGTKAIPVLLVSAKAESVRDEFRTYTNVVDFVAKPFTGPDLLRRIKRALGPVRSVTSRFSREQQARAAKILYARLRDGLSLLPAAVHAIGASPAGPVLAKHLLTPEAVAGILDDLFALYEEGRPDNKPDLEPVEATAIVDRASGFSSRVLNANLSAVARHVLFVVNGRSTIEEIARRLGNDPQHVGRVARELIDSGLLVARTSMVRSRPVVILEPDVQGFQRPLASLLEARPEAPALVVVDNLHEVVAVTKRVNPCLVVVNATSETSRVGSTARELRADASLSDVSLVALLDRARPADSEDLYSAGFDAVLNKPVIVGDLERFIALHRKEEPWTRS